MAKIAALMTDGGGAEKPTLLWSNASGTNSNIPLDHSAYQYLIFVCGSTRSWCTKKKTTLCDKTQERHLLAMGTLNADSYTYMMARITTGSITFPKKEESQCLCYAIYGCNSLNIDYTDIWARGDIG